MSDSTSPSRFLAPVTRMLDALLEISEAHEGLFPGLIDRTKGRMLRGEMPPQLPGLRDSDRSHLGSNFSHDIPLLEALFDLAGPMQRPDYASAAQRYLERFATHCAPASVSGLWPWGEHSFWDLERDAIGNSYLNTPYYKEHPEEAAVPTHHQLRTVPRRLWETLWVANPAAVTRFAEGLEWHWTSPEHLRFNRHAPITEKTYNYQHLRYARLKGLPVPTATADGADFSATSGYFVHNLCVARSICPSPAQGRLLRDYADYWWTKRQPNGLLQVSTSRPNPGIAMTLGYASTLLQASQELPGTEAAFADELRSRANVHLEGVLSVDQPLENGGFIHQIEPDGKPFKATPLWTAPDRGRGGNTASQGNKLLAAYRILPDERLLALALRIGAVYLETPPPRGGDVRAADFAYVLALLLSLWKITSETRWITGAGQIGTIALELFFDGTFPRAGLSRDHYEAQAGGSLLLRSLQELALG